MPQQNMLVCRRPLIAKLDYSPKTVTLNQLKIGQASGVTVEGTGSYETIVLEGDAITQTEEFVPEESIESEIAALAQRLNDAAQESAGQPGMGAHVTPMEQAAALGAELDTGDIVSASPHEAELVAPIGGGENHRRRIGAGAIEKAEWRQIGHIRRRNRGNPRDRPRRDARDHRNGVGRPRVHRRSDQQLR